MPGIRPVERHAAYRYDGSLAGFYCCVFESYAMREEPVSIAADGEDVEQLTLIAERYVNVDPARALRVRNGLTHRGTLRSRELLENVFLTHLEKRELTLLAFIHRVFDRGPAVLEQLSDPLICMILRAEKRLLSEAHLFTGFVRFVETDMGLISSIEPKNFVLPLIAPHFTERMCGEAFLIYDKTHGSAIAHEPGKPYVIGLMEPPDERPTKAETRVQALWRQFYKTIGIEERYNPTCRRTHMPMRFWSNMTEMKE